MKNDANSGWVYHIGDSIFGDVLLVDANELNSVFAIYASKVSIESNSNREQIQKKTNIVKYDCIIINETDSVFIDASITNEYYNRLKKDGVLAIISNNATSFKNIKNINYFLLLFKKLFIFYNEIYKKYKFISLSKENFSRYYMQSDYGRISEVFYNDGYIPIKNPFLTNQKIRKYLLSKLFFPVFSSLTLDILSESNAPHDTVINNIINKAGIKTGLNFLKIHRCLIIPYKVLVSVSTNNNDKYIFLLLRGSDKNVRANKELEMIKYLNKNYPEFSSYISKPITNGVYKNVEYIVYSEISGVIIDSIFDNFNIAEHSAFKKLIELGTISKKNTEINASLFKELTHSWFMRLNECSKESNKFSGFIDDFRNTLRKKVIGKHCNLVHFHGDYKIENIIFIQESYSVRGIIDWDLSMVRNFPGLDLVYFIIYNRRIKNATTFIEECEDVFLNSGFSNAERKMILEYCEKFIISKELFSVICILFILHHFSYRERCCTSEAWLIKMFNSMIKYL